MNSNETDSQTNESIKMKESERDKTVSKQKGTKRCFKNKNYLCTITTTITIIQKREKQKNKKKTISPITQMYICALVCTQWVRCNIQT